MFNESRHANSKWYFDIERLTDINCVSWILLIIKGSLKMPHFFLIWIGVLYCDFNYYINLKKIIWGFVFCEKGNRHDGKGTEPHDISFKNKWFRRRNKGRLVWRTEKLYFYFWCNESKIKSNFAFISLFV